MTRENGSLLKWVSGQGPGVPRLAPDNPKPFELCAQGFLKRQPGSSFPSQCQTFKKAAPCLNRSSRSTASLRSSHGSICSIRFSGSSAFQTFNRFVPSSQIAAVRGHGSTVGRTAGEKPQRFGEVPKRRNDSQQLEVPTRHLKPVFVLSSFDCYLGHLQRNPHRQCIIADAQRRAQSLQLPG